jgi:hypothetical protein
MLVIMVEKWLKPIKMKELSWPSHKTFSVWNRFHIWKTNDIEKQKFNSTLFKDRNILIDLQVQTLVHWCIYFMLSKSLINQTRKENSFEKNLKNRRKQLRFWWYLDSGDEINHEISAKISVETKTMNILIFCFIKLFL